MKRFYLACILFFSTPAWADWYQDQQSIMGTKISLTLWHKDKQVAQTAIAEVMEAMRGIDQRLSPYKPESDLSRVNQLASKQLLKLSTELAFLIDKSLFYSRVGDGAFDITFASLGRYYDYRKKLKPDEKLRQSLLESINYQHIDFDKKKSTIHFTNPHVYIDLGGIAKGYAVDLAADILARHGVQHATISAGGDSRIIGDKRGRPWIIGIKNPRQKKGGNESLIRMPLENVAVSTSGDYERFFIDETNGERVHHILNPRTGTSAREVVSVTILGPTGVDTDPLSTTVFVLGVKKGLALINKFSDFDCVIIDAKGRAHYSSGLLDPSVE